MKYNNPNNYIIGIIGLGFVGGAMLKSFSIKKIKIIGYDKYEYEHGDRSPVALYRAFAGSLGNEYIPLRLKQNLGMGKDLGLRLGLEGLELRPCGEPFPIRRMNVVYYLADPTDQLGYRATEYAENRHYGLPKREG